MTGNAPAPPEQPWSGTMDVDAFMAFLETRPNGEHWELIEGVAVMMAPASPAHQRDRIQLLQPSERRFCRKGFGPVCLQ